MCNNQKNKKLLSCMSNLQTYYHFKLDFQKVDQHTGLIHGTKRQQGQTVAKPGTPPQNILVGNVILT